MEQEKKQAVALMRYSAIAPLITVYALKKSVQFIVSDSISHVSVSLSRNSNVLNRVYPTHKKRGKPFCFPLRPVSYRYFIFPPFPAC